MNKIVVYKVTVYYDFVHYGYFHGGVEWYYIRVLGYNLLIRPKVQLYFHSGTCYIINSNFRLVKSWQISLRPIGARALLIPLVPFQATHINPIGLVQKANPIR